MNILMWWEDFDGKVPAPTILKPEPVERKQTLSAERVIDLNSEFI